MDRDERLILAVNGGSSSIKFALFEAGTAPKRILKGVIDGIGRPEAAMRVEGRGQADHFSRSLKLVHYGNVAGLLADWIKERCADVGLTAAGHRVVSGGPKYNQAQRISGDMLDELRRLSPFDPEHMSGELQLIEAFQRCFPGLPQVACFDTAFHHDMPQVARLLPIPRRYGAKGLRRYGFHGLSYQFLIEELERLDGAEVARGRVILAHLGNGASLAALKGGKSQDTSMGFTPASGLLMGTRSGDLDPGIFPYLARSEGMDAEGFNSMINFHSGLLGISDTSSDMRVLLGCEGQDPRAQEAVALFCYQVKKWVGSFAAALDGLDTLVFSGGIGENAPSIRTRICKGLGFLGISIDETLNAKGEGILSAQGSGVSVRVIRTDEEFMIARIVCTMLDFA